MKYLKSIKIHASDIQAVRSALDTVIRDIENSKHIDSLKILKDIKQILTNLIAERCEKDMASEYYHENYSKYAKHRDAAEEIKKDTNNLIYCVKTYDNELQLKLLGITEGKNNE